MTATTALIDVADRSLEVATWKSANADSPVVLLHDGLGSISQWRDVPRAIAARTGRTVIAYNRAGHGRSTPVPEGPWPADWLHTEAEVLQRLITDLEIERPVLVGHSDGASIALLHSARQPGAVRAVLSLAAHSYVEPICADAIAALRADPGPIVIGLSRHHDHPERIFDAWSQVWTSDEFARWDVRPMLGSIDAPTLIVQGEADEYGTTAMAVSTAAAIGTNATCRLLPDVGHLIHHQVPDIVVDLVSEIDPAE